MIVTDVMKLRETSKDTDLKEASILNLESRLKREMLSKQGIGLAAIQIGIPVRAFVMQLNSKQTLFVLNPKILRTRQERVFPNEGCLSFPGKRVHTRRYSSIDVEYLNSKGEIVETTLVGLEAVVFQHEYDHLDGKIMFDRRETFGTPIESKEKMGRNVSCPCGSGKKYKHCCLDKIELNSNV